MCSIVLQHPEAPREVAVLLDRRIHLGFEKLFIPRPGHKLVINRVAQVQNTRLPGGDSLKHRIVVRARYEECGKSSRNGESWCALGTRSVERAAGMATRIQKRPAAAISHLSSHCSKQPGARHQGSGIPGVATIPAMRRIS